MDDGKPTMHLIVGPNGAGKSTLYETVIAPIIKAPFINADIIQKNEMSDHSPGGAYEAARIAEARRREYLEKKESFVSESTFSHPSKLRLVEDAIRQGFRVIIYHVSVASPELSIARVSARVREGGHHVPEDKIRKRYESNQSLIKEAVLKSNIALIYDNSNLNQGPKWIFKVRNGSLYKAAGAIPEWAEYLYKNELKRFRNNVATPPALRILK